jgi:UDP-N-acetylmuramate dehydrogenase
METTARLQTLTTFRIGGTPMRYFEPAGVGELREALAACADTATPWQVMGGGSNLLVEDGPLPFAVVRIHAPGFAALDRTGPATVGAGAGVPIARLLSFCRREELGGLEYLAGLPGTVGGAVAGNAGAWNRCVTDRVRDVTIMDPDGSLRKATAGDLGAGYRRTELDGGVVVAVEFGLEPRNGDLIRLRMQRHMDRRLGRHPLKEFSAGCIFRNPPGRSAGELIDRCGLKGYRIGGAQISERHANFILNCGGAAAADVLALIRLVREAVRREHGVVLELEVRHWTARDGVGPVHPRNQTEAA